MTEILDGIAALADRYDGFILDVWGVLHDGVAPYPGVTEALDRLKAAGKRVTLLSNAARRAATVAEQIEQIGVPRLLFQHVMTSGEEVWQNLKRRDDPFYSALGTNCLWLGSDRQLGMVEGLGLTLVEMPEAADFILNTGPDDLDDEATILLPLFRRAVASRVPMICVNPDLHVMHGGNLIVCAGQVTKVYESLGGTAHWHGKPFPSVYRSCLELLGLSDRRRILAVGDSLRTDIAGADSFGLDSLLIAGGIHAEDFGYVGTALDRSRVAQHLAGELRPTYIAGRLNW